MGSPQIFAEELGQGHAGEDASLLVRLGLQHVPHQTPDVAGVSDPRRSGSPTIGGDCGRGARRFGGERQPVAGGGPAGPPCAQAQNGLEWPGGIRPDPLDGPPWPILPEP